MRPDASVARSRPRSPVPVAGVALVLGAMLAGARQPVAARTPTPPTTAALLRTVGVGRDPVALAVDGQAGRVFVVGAAGSVTTLDATTGGVMRTIAVGRGAQAVVVDEATGRAFVTDPGRVFVLDARTGTVLRALSVGGGGPTGGLAVDAPHGEVFVATRGAAARNPVAPPQPGSVVVLDTATGRTRRTIHTDADLLAVDGVARRIILPYSCGDTPGVADMCVDTLDAVTGRRIKTADLSSQQGYEQQPSAVAVDGRAGRAFVLYGDGRGVSAVGMLATRTGVGQGTVGGAAGTLGTIAIDERVGRVAIVTVPDSYAAGSAYGLLRTAFVSVLDTRTGRDLTNTTVPTAPQAYVFVPGAVADQRRGRFYVVATLYTTAAAILPRSILDVFAASSGRLLRTLTLPTAVGQPNASVGPAMAVDGRTGRLFITNGGNNTVSVLDTAHL